MWPPGLRLICLHSVDSIDTMDDYKLTRTIAICIPTVRIVKIVTPCGHIRSFWSVSQELNGSGSTQRLDCTQWSVRQSTTMKEEMIDQHECEDTGFQIISRPVHSLITCNRKRVFVPKEVYETKCYRFTVFQELVKSRRVTQSSSILDQLRKLSLYLQEPSKISELSAKSEVRVEKVNFDFGLHQWQNLGFRM